MQNYIEAIEKCLNQCKEMLQLESEKRRALAVNLGKDIEDVVRKQQAALMKLETLEQQRMQAQQQLGYDSAATATQILEQMPSGPEKDRLADLVAQLRQVATDLKEQNKDSLELAKLDLRLIESLRAGGQQNTTQSGVYSRSQAAKPPQGTKFNGSF